MEDYLNSKRNEVILDKSWWYRFKQKYTEKLIVIKIHSLEWKRFSVDKVQVLGFFDSLENELKTTHPSIVINVDESGFLMKPDKNTTHNCVCIRNFPVTPYFKDEMDGNQISIVPAVTLSGKTLRPFLFSTTINLPNEIRTSSFGGSFEWFKTEKGYLNEHAMIAWINDILLTWCMCFLYHRIAHTYSKTLICAFPE